MKKSFLLLFITLTLIQSYGRRDVRDNIDSLIEQALLIQLRNIDSMNILADSIRRLSEQNNYKRGEAYYYLFKAIDMRTKMNIISAIKQLNTAMSLFEKSGDKVGLFIAINELLMDVRFVKRDINMLPQKPKLPKNTLAKLLEFEYYVNAVIYDNLVSTDSIKRIINKIKKIKSELKNKYEFFVYNHNLAKLSYDLARLYEKQSQHDSALKYYKRSIYYDSLLKNRQAWSIFTVAGLYLKLYLQDTTKKFLLDSIRKYNILSLEALNFYQPLSTTPIDFIDSLAKNNIYIYQLANISKNFLEYLIWTDNTNKKAKIQLNAISDTLFQQIIHIPAEYFNNLITKQKQQERFRTILFISFSIFLIILLVMIYVHRERLKQKNTVLNQYNKKLNTFSEELLNKNDQLADLNEQLKAKNKELKELNEVLNLKAIVIESILHSISHIETTLYKLVNDEMQNKILKKEILLYTPILIESLHFFQNISLGYKEHSIFNIAELLSDLRYLVILYPEIDTEFKVEGFKIQSNKVILKHVIYNILHNSIKVLKSKDIENPKIIIKSKRIGKNTYAVEIEDNAGGIDIKKVESLNAKKYQRKNGYGSGLYLIQELCKVLANVEYEFSLIDSGTKVTLYFYL